MRIHQHSAFIPILALLTFALTGCASPASANTDLVLTDIHTSVALTVAAATGQVTPSATLGATPTPFPTIMPFLTSLATATSSASYYSYASGCDNAAYVRDVTIADGAEVGPGETFTKTWEFLNTGSCDWSSNYSIVFISGSDMDGSETEIDQRVSVGSHGDISVSLTAPDDTGKYTGYWSLANAGGTAFGEQVYVQIVVTGDVATETPTPTPEEANATATDQPATAQATSTPNPIETQVETATSMPDMTLSPTLEAATTCTLRDLTKGRAIGG